MPLSEDEQRILRQIEEQLQSDPSFPRNFSQVSRRSGSRRMIILSAIGVVGCLAVLIATLQVSAWLSFVAFLAMLAAAVVFERELRALGRNRFQQHSSSLPWRRQRVHRD